MSNLNIKIHTKNKISIKDNTHPIDVSEFKWDKLFRFLLDNTKSVYFYGLRINVKDNQLSKNIDFATEEIFINENFNRILFRLKNANLFNRGLLKNICVCYETAVLVFLMDKKDEDDFIESIYENIMIKNCLRSIEGYFIVYQGMEEDVLWVESDQNFSTIHSLI